MKTLSPRPSYSALDEPRHTKLVGEPQGIFGEAPFSRVMYLVHFALNILA